MLDEEKTARDLAADKAEAAKVFLAFQYVEIKDLT